jgi:hypothetical protein
MNLAELRAEMASVAEEQREVEQAIARLSGEMLLLRERQNALLARVRRIRKEAGERQ